MEYSIIYTYYDDVLDCGRYAQDVFTFDSYKKAVKAFYSGIKNNEDEPVGISTDFRIKKLDLFLHGDFRFCVKSYGSAYNYTYSNLFNAIKCLFKKNKHLIKWIYKAIFIYKVELKGLRDFIKIDMYTLKIISRY
jgi:hypothetical protein